MTYPQHDKGNRFDQAVGIAASIARPVQELSHTVYQAGKFVVSLPARFAQFIEELEQNIPEGIPCPRDLLQRSEPPHVDDTKNTSSLD